MPLILFIISLLIAPSSGHAALTTKRSMPEFYGKYEWHNSGPIRLKDLTDQVVLVGFWNYSCAPCLRDIPQVKYFSETYDRIDLKIVMIHNPEYEFEKKTGGLTAALKRFGIKYAVVNDRDDTLWNSYQNRTRPAYYAVDGRGRIREVFSGEISWEKIEKTLRDLILEKGGIIDHEPAPPKSPVEWSEVKSPVMNFGYESSEFMGNIKKLTADYPQNFDEPQTAFLNRFYLVGRWEAQGNFFRLLQAPGALIVRYRANGVQLVAGSNHEIPRRSDVLLGGYAMIEADRGGDVYLKDQQSYLTIEDSRLYQVADHGDHYGEQELRINFPEAGIALYQLNFGRLFLEKNASGVEDKKKATAFDF